MAVDLKQKLAAFHVKPSENKEGIVLPQAFIARTVKAIGRVPKGVDVLVERTALGDFMLTWFDEMDRPAYQGIAKDSGIIDISDVYAQSRAALLGAIPVEDLHAEIRRRDDAARLAASEGSEAAK